MHAERAGWSPDEIMRAATRPGSALPRIDFGAEIERCPACDRQTSVYKSRTRTVVTLAQGQFEAREILERCDGDGCPAVGPEKLRRLVPPRQRYGYDLICRRWRCSTSPRWSATF